MTSHSIDVRLAPLESEHVAELCRLLGLKQENVEGYLAEELLGWSMARVVLVRGNSSGGHRDEGAFRIVGLIQASKIDHHQGYAILGTWLVPDVWGTGVNAAAKEQMLRQLSKLHPDITYIYLCISAGNIRSIKAARKLPYAEEISETRVPAPLVSEMAQTSGSEARCWFEIRILPS